MKKLFAAAVRISIKIIASFIFAAILFPFSSSAQKFRLGLTGSVGMTWIKPTSTGLTRVSSNLGLGYGAVVDYNFTDNYAFSTGANILYKGGEIRADFGGTKTLSDITLQYIEVPLTLKMKTNQIGHLKYFGQVGLGTGINIKALSDEEFTDINNIKTTVSNKGIASDINTFSASFIIGAGVEFPVNGNTSLTSSILFDNGLTDILDGDNKSICNYLSLSVGVLF